MLRSAVCRVQMRPLGPTPAVLRAMVRRRAASKAAPKPRQHQHNRVTVRLGVKAADTAEQRAHVGSDRWMHRLLYERLPEHAKHWPAFLVLNFGVLIMAMGVFPEVHDYVEVKLPALYWVAGPIFRLVERGMGIQEAGQAVELGADSSSASATASETALETPSLAETTTSSDTTTDR